MVRRDSVEPDVERVQALRLAPQSVALPHEYALRGVVVGSTE
jgi:hypothetical protein